MKFKQLISKTGHSLKQHSPAIFTGVGIVGLGATAYLAYKSRDKVEKIVLKVEETREEGLEINKVEVAKDIAEAIYLPVTVGALSVGAIFMSYRIQNNRIAVLAGTLASQRAYSALLDRKYKAMHGEESYKKWTAPTEFEQVETGKLDKDGNPKTKVVETKQDVDKTIGQWYDESLEYAADDHSYNMAYIDSINERLQTILFQRGALMLNEVREALGFERIRNGALLGWTTSDSFDITKAVTNIHEADGEMKEQIWVSWSRPRYIYEEVEFNGRYSING